MINPNAFFPGDTFWLHEHSFVHEVKAVRLDTPYVEVVYVSNGYAKNAWLADIFYTEKEADKASLEWLKHRQLCIEIHIAKHHKTSV